jgi:SAM-dependent methyltransferase
LNLEYLKQLRLAEVEQALPFFPAGSRVLEFGAGTGEQAQFLADHGFDVVAIDLASSDYAGDRIYPVQDYDGRRIPLEDHSIAVIFSSNVLEHVENLDEILGEFRRILKPDGLALHVLPTPAWRLWSFATGAAMSLRAAAALPASLARPSTGIRRWQTVKRNLRQIASGFVPRGHGTSPEGLSELWTFSRAAWRRRFEKAGFEVVDDRPMGLFYTGSLISGAALSIERRRQLSHILGSSTYLYKIKVRTITA